MVARLQKFADQLSDVQASDITSVSSCETLTFQDSIKSQVEMRLGEEWDWWPLEPPLLPLPPNQARIRWHCVSHRIKVNDVDLVNKHRDVEMSVGLMCLRHSLKTSTVG